MPHLYSNQHKHGVYVLDREAEHDISLRSSVVWVHVSKRGEPIFRVWAALPTHTFDVRPGSGNAVMDAAKAADGAAVNEAIQRIGSGDFQLGGTYEVTTITLD